MAGALLLLFAPACNQEFDAAERGSATQDQYALTNQTCEVQGDRLVATGDLKNHSGSAQEFGLVVRYFDGEVDIGRPQSLDRTEVLADGATWSWEVAQPIDEPPERPRCDVIQVVIGSDVDLSGD